VELLISLSVVIFYPGDEQPLIVVDGVPIDNTMYNSDNPDNGTNNNLVGVLLMLIELLT